MFIKQSFAEDDFVTYVGETGTEWYRRHIYKIHIGDCVVATNLNYDGSIRFNVPLYRWLGTDDVSVKRVTGRLVVRMGNNAGTGLYIIKGSSGGSDTAAFDTDTITSSSFYNASNQLKSFNLASMYNTESSIHVTLYGSGDYLFSGNATNLDRIQYNAGTAWLTNVDVYVEVGE